MTRMIANARNRLSEHWHNKTTNWSNRRFHSFSSPDHSNAFCAAKDWLQDTAETLCDHRTKGFAPDPIPRYLEFLGVMQALFLQQDAIRQLFYSLGLPTEAFGEYSKKPEWTLLRNLRNLTAGHPTAKSYRSRNGVAGRIVIGRDGIQSYNHVSFALFDDIDFLLPGGKPARRHNTVSLAEVIDAYDLVGAEAIDTCTDALLIQLK